jgi:hypothetical protein
MLSIGAPTSIRNFGMVKRRKKEKREKKREREKEEVNEPPLGSSFGSAPDKYCYTCGRTTL